MNEDIMGLEGIDLSQYLPKQQNETLTADKIGGKVIATIKNIRQVDTRYGKKLVLDIETKEKGNYAVFLNKLSIQSLYQLEKDVNKWLGKEVAIDKVQVVVRGAIKNTLLVKFEQ